MVYALNIDDPTVNPIAKYSSLASILNFFIPLLLIGAAILFLAMLLWGGFVWVTAGDSSENIKKAQKMLTFAIMGMAMVFLSFLAVKLIGIILRVPTLTPS